MLSGGVGGAKLVLGMERLLGDDGKVTAIVNTGDDFRHLGLAISPDIDTLLYTLSGKSNVAQGWGRADETWSFLQAVRSLSGEDWFALGDGDLALHVLRTAALAKGEPLSQIVARFAASWGIATRILPMTDDGVATWIDSPEGPLAFQEYFVARRCEPAVRAIRFDGAEAAAPAPGVIDAIETADLVVIAPSNPYLSVDPILAVPGIRQALGDTPARVVAVSPVMNGQAFKGPTAKLMGELGLPVTSATIAAHYAPFLNVMIVDHDDEIGDQGVEIVRTDIAMSTLDQKVALARTILDSCLR